MSNPRNTLSQLTDAQGNNRTATHLASNIIIKVDNYIVGAVQSLSYDEKRSIKMIDEVGTDGHIDSAPNKSTDISGTCERVRFDGARIAEAFGRGFIHAKSQRIPFDIEIHDIFADSDGNSSVITVIKNVWINSITTQYQVSDWIVAERMGFEAEDIFSLLNNKPVVSGTLNGQNGVIRLDSIEQAADVGQFRGSMDAANVINAFIDDALN